MRRLRKEPSSALHPAHGKLPQALCAGDKKRVWNVRANGNQSTLPHTGVSHSSRASLASFFISRLMAVKGGSPGNAQRLTSERGAPVRRR